MAAFLFACQSASQRNDKKPDSVPKGAPRVVNADSLIVPGKSIGNIRLGMDAAPVIKLMGTPSGGDAAMGKATVIWNTGDDLTAIYTERNMGVDDTARILQIRSTLPGYLTDKNIGVGVTLDDIELQMPVARLGEYTEGKDTFALYVTRAGISFEINRDQQCTGIIVHPAGTDPTKAYLPFHSNLRK